MASQDGAFQTLDFATSNVDPDSIGNVVPPTYDRVASFRASPKYVPSLRQPTESGRSNRLFFPSSLPSGQCLLFGMESGSMHLCATSVVCRFNDASVPTEFASSYAEGLVAPLMEALEGEEEDFFIPPSIHLALSRSAGETLGHGNLKNLTVRFWGFR